MSRSSLTKPFRVMALLVALTLLLAAPASAAFLTFVEVHRDGEGGVDGLFGAHGVTASPDGAHVYVAGTYDDALAAFSRDTTTGKLTFLEVHWDNVDGVDGLDAVISVMVSPDGKHVYATSAADDAVVVFIRDVITGRLTFLEMHKDGLAGVDGLDRAERVAISPDGAYLYVAGHWDNALVAFGRNVTTGELTFVEVYWDGVDGIDGLDGATSVAVSPDGEHVYATSTFDEAVATFSRDGATGELTFIEVHRDGVNGVDGLGGAHDVTVSHDGKHVYVVGALDDALAVFSRDKTTGELTFIEVYKDGVNGVDGLDWARSVTVSPDGAHVCATGSRDDALVVFSRSAVTGKLTFLEVHVDGVGGVDGLYGAYGVTVSPDGKHVYAMGSYESALAVFSTGQPIAVAVDVKPRSCPNPLNVKSRGKLPVAILGTDAFDVHQIDPASVRLEGVAPLRWALKDAAAPYEPFVGKGDARDCTTQGPDGYGDLTLKFDTREIVAALGEVHDGEVRVLELTGNLREEFGGTPIVGEDVVVILKKGKK